MEEINKEIERLKESLLLLIDKYTALSAENATLKSNLLEANRERRDLKEKNIELENKILHLQSDPTLWRGKTEKEKLKKRLDGLVKEIDSCLLSLKGGFVNK